MVRIKPRACQPRLGEAVYVAEQSWSEVPDPGATRLVYLLGDHFSN